jgi:hypothetical protein
MEIKGKFIAKIYKIKGFNFINFYSNSKKEQ